MPPAPLDVPEGDISNLRGVSFLNGAYTYRDSDLILCKMARLTSRCTGVRISSTHEPLPE